MKRLVAALLALPVVAWVAPASAQLEPAGVVTTLQGTASVSRASLPLAPLKFKDPVYLRDRITTGEESIARILLGGKAIVTVRERSVLTITELPGTSIIEVSSGKAALAVVKERMKPGNSIEIRTPNAVAAIRGTVVITEVQQVGAQLGPAPIPVETRFIGLTGSFDVSQLQGGQRVGAPITVTASQSAQFAGGAAPRVQTLTRDVLQRFAREYRINVPTAPATTNTNVTADQVQQAAAHANALSGRPGAPTSPTAPGTPPAQGTEGAQSTTAGTPPTGAPPAGAPPGGGTSSTGTTSAVQGGGTGQPPTPLPNKPPSGPITLGPSPKPPTPPPPPPIKPAPQTKPEHDAKPQKQK
ncbi:MAG: FecR domain-containing protein [Candidatus Rokubacteria bacterium]|nr:FecR domain-containing protein [Candidatus Rokubacteria bacterium]